MGIESTMLYIGGSKRSFRCECGCNVFHQLSEDRWACNACEAEYTTEWEKENTDGR